jgi:hypothetical protein
MSPDSNWRFDTPVTDSVSTDKTNPIIIFNNAGVASSTGDEIEQALTTGSNVRAVLDVVRGPKPLGSRVVTLYSRSTTATGFLVDRPSKSYGKTCVLC